MRSIECIIRGDIVTADPLNWFTATGWRSGPGAPSNLSLDHPLRRQSTLLEPCRITSKHR